MITKLSLRVRSNCICLLLVQLSLGLLATFNQRFDFSDYDTTPLG